MERISMSCLRKLILLLLASTCAAQTHTYPALDTNNTFTGTNTFNNSVAANVLQGEVDANRYSDIGAACSASAAVYIQAGTIQPTAQITCPQPTRFRGAGVGVTIIKPTSALVAALFSATATGEGWGWADMTIDMTNVPTIGVFNWNGITRPILNNVRVIYPTGGTGTVIYKANTGEAHVTNLIAKNPGICVDIQGDSGAEDFWADVICESPSTAGYRLSRTTSTDVGGQYLLRFKVTNPFGASSGSGFIVSSTVVNTGEPWWCYNCVADNQGGKSLYVNNMVTVNSTGGWYRAGTGEGVEISNTTEYTSSQDNMSGAHCDLKFTGFATTVHLSGSPVFSGSVANVCVGSATLAGVVIIDPVYSASPPMTAADTTALAAAWPTSTGFFSGGLWVRANNTVAPAKFKLYTDVTGATNPNKWFSIDSIGDLLILPSSNTGSAIFSLSDAGVLSLQNSLQLNGNAILGIFSLTPSAAGGGMGTNPLPWGGLALGTVANQTTTLTTNATANRGVAIGDAGGTLTLNNTTPTVNTAVCWKDVTNKVLGYCSTALSGSPPTCTCN